MATEQDDIVLAWKATHKEMHAMWERIYELRHGIAGSSTDTHFALGVALGEFGKAKALLGRDIDQAEGR